MRVVRGVFYVVLALAGLFLAAGLFLPDRAHVERSMRISASPSTVYGIVSGFRRFNEWSPWYGLDPKASYTYSGPTTGVGARMAWSSADPKVGSGSQEILAVEPDRQVTIRLAFGGQGPSQATIKIVPEGSGSRVTWSFDASFEGRYFDRYLGLLFDRFIGPDYEKGLAKLKALAEAAPSVP